MKSATLIVFCAIASLAPVRSAAAQVAGETTLGVTVEEMKLVVLGWSAKKQLFDKDVYNDKNQDIGVIEDITISPKKTVSWAIIGVGGFLGIAERKVAIPAVGPPGSHLTWPHREDKRATALVALPSTPAGVACS